jgi:hypothetical protein
MVLLPQDLPGDPRAVIAHDFRRIDWPARPPAAPPGQARTETRRPIAPHKTRFTEQLSIHKVIRRLPRPAAPGAGRALLSHRAIGRLGDCVI